jgi:hypothetical protein
MDTENLGVTTFIERISFCKGLLAFIHYKITELFS